MAELRIPRVAILTEVAQRRLVLLTCIVATCARNLEPPLWIYRTPETTAFNQASNEFSMATGLFTLSLLALVLIGGVLGDLSGRKRLLLIGLGGLVVAHLLLPLARGPQWFIFTRVLSGAFGAPVPSLSLSLLYQEFIDIPKARARAISIYVLVTSSAFLLAGSIGSITHRFLDWQAPTALPTGLGVVAFLLAQRTLSESRANIEHRFDVFGYASWGLIVLSLLGTSVALYGVGIYAMVGLILGLAGLTVGASLLSWWGRKMRAEQSASARRIRRRALAVLILFGFAMQFGFVGFIVQVRQALMNVYGYHPVLATIALAPLMIGMLIVTVVIARRPPTAEPRLLLGAGLMIGATACIVTSITQATAIYPLLALLLLVFGASLVLATITWMTLFLTSVPDGVVGVRTGINSAVFAMGGTLGTLVTGGLLVEYGMAAYARLLAGAGVAPEGAEQALAALNLLLYPGADTSAVPADLAGRLLAGYQIAYLDAYGRVLLIIALVLAAGAAVAWFGLARLGKDAEAA